MKLTRIITITGLGGLSLACGGVTAPPCGPLAAEGRACAIERQCLIPGQASDCGINGYACRDGAWRALVTYCNPPPPPEPPGCDRIDLEAACNSGDSCAVASPEDCGVIGYSCVDARWQAERAGCNPPPEG